MQFNLRTLMLATAAVAACAAAIAPFFRQLSELTQTRLVIVLGSLAVTNLLGIAGIVVLDTKMSQVAGKCFVQVKSGRRAAWTMFAGSLCVAMLHATLVIWQVNYKTSKGCGIYEIIYDCFTPLILLTYWVPNAVFMFRASYLRFCEHGLIHGGFTPRSKISNPRWVRDKLLVTLPGHFQQEFAVSPADHAAVDLVLERWRAAATDDKHQNHFAPRRLAMFVAAVLAVPLLFLIAWFFAPAPTRAVPVWARPPVGATLTPANTSP
ncbi:MAG: hypothetical protein SGJ19_22170 [Planctomycetia bacterium]|nr:hypothetical protein [Planctomycetia bacterium]